MEDSLNICPVILAGGGGTRLWPLSRDHYPKQFLSVIGERTLLQQTLTRLDDLGGGFEVEPPLVICNEAHRFLVAEQARSLELHLRRIVLEPTGRNTAPALTVAALQRAQDDEDAILVMLPADHSIGDEAGFRNALLRACRVAAGGAIVTFGIVPDRPETGYGYIRHGHPWGDAAASDGDQQAFEVAAFVEKPDAARARSYVESGDYSWNSGIFIMRARVWLAAMERHAQDILDACRQALAGSEVDGDFCRLDREAFTACRSDSVDYAVMEQVGSDAALSAAVLPIEVGWSDVGSWSSLWEISPQGDDGNVVNGDVCTIDSANSLLIAQHRFLAALGCEDLVVIETADAVLVMPKARAQETKRVVEWLKARERDERLTHRRVYRPWGSYEPLDVGEGFQVKRITVNPGQSLSLQMHHRRAEHWIVVRGTARVTRGDKEFDLAVNESTYIPIGTKHRLANLGTEELEIIEVQSGDYLGEDDIVRFDDVYKRHLEKS